MGEERHLLLRPLARDPFLPEVVIVAADRRDAATWNLNLRNPHGSKRSTAETARRASWLSPGCRNETESEKSNCDYTHKTQHTPNYAAVHEYEVKREGALQVRCVRQLV